MDEQPFKPKIPKIHTDNNNTFSMLIESKSLVATIILFFVAIIVLLIVNSGSGNKSSVKLQARAVVTNHTTTTPNKPNNQVAIWQSNYGNQLVTLENDINNVNTQVANETYSGQETACQQLGTDVTSDQATPGIPDATAANDFSNGLSELSNAAQSCVAGSQIYLNQADNSNPQIELQAGSDLSTFSTDLKSGTANIQNTITEINNSIN